MFIQYECDCVGLLIKGEDNKDVHVMIRRCNDRDSELGFAWDDDYCSKKKYVPLGTEVSERLAKKMDSYLEMGQRFETIQRLMAYKNGQEGE